MKLWIIWISGIVIILTCSIQARVIFKEIIVNIALIFKLAKSDIKIKYAGSYLGILWAYMQPILTTFIYWFVFQIGFKSAPVEDFPFILWLISGLVPWFFFSDAIITATNCMIEYSYLVKKVVFQIDILPAVKICSALLVHIVFLIFIFALFGIYRIKIDIYCFQIIYYSFCIIILLLSISYLTATINVFVKDTIQAINIIMQLIFWMTPIVWDVNIMPASIQKLLKLNPFFYIVNGFRDALINKIWFWDKYNQTIYFWVFTSILLMFSTFIFKKFKPHFADVL